VTAEGLSGEGSGNHSSDTHGRVTVFLLPLYSPTGHEGACRGREGAGGGLGATRQPDNSAHLLSLSQKQNL